MIYVVFCNFSSFEGRSSLGLFYHKYDLEYMW